MLNVGSIEQLDYNLIPEDSIWNDEAEVLKMHSIHAYPAKFPPFLAGAVFDYAKMEGVNVETVADVFCGCGTVALEAKIRGKNFWGCDINPVATLIARTKSRDYNLDILKTEYEEIITEAKRIDSEKIDLYSKANERLKYWYTEAQYNKLKCIKTAIENVVEDKTYKDAFLCLFSAILKRTSKWLQKSIKPQMDQKKNVVDPFDEFKHRFTIFYDAVNEMNCIRYKGSSHVNICNESVFLDRDNPKCDLIITSPPYVTSYEYADLHQLSLLWLNYCDDYRKMRKGTVGSSYNCGNNEQYLLNVVASDTVGKIKESGFSKSKWMPIASYYRDMERVVGITKRMMNDKGMIVFVIGNSTLKGIKLDNSRHLIKTMIDVGYTDIKISKRCISKGICVPYRDGKGKFTNEKENSKKIYHEEYVISGRSIC